MTSKPREYDWLGRKIVKRGRPYPGLSGHDLYATKLWAKAHGYSGMTGGWIYRDRDGQHIAHGWGQFNLVMGPGNIEKWYQSQRKVKE